jgi:hypothetical protein
MLAFALCGLGLVFLSKTGVFSGIFKAAFDLNLFFAC